MPSASWGGPEQDLDDASVKPRTLECALGAQSAILGRLAQILLQQLPRSLFDIWL
jgi:hypothetical protein